MAKCGCSGQTCGCAIKGGAGAVVTGTGTVADPFRIAVDPSTLALATIIRTTNSNTIEFVRTGSGSTVDPILISGSIVLKSPDNSRWAPSISNAGVVTWAKL